LIYFVDTQFLEIYCLKNTALTNTSSKWPRVHVLDISCWLPSMATLVMLVYYYKTQYHLMQVKTTLLRSKLCSIYSIRDDSEWTCL